MNRKQFIQVGAGLLGALGLGIGCNNEPVNNFTYKGLKRKPPSNKEFLDYSNRFKNWGRWGDNDKLGTLNFIDQKKVLESSKLIKEGKSISLGRPLTNVEFSMQIFTKQFDWGKGKIGVAQDKIAIIAHGYTDTHIDALSHIFSVDGKIYNGHPETDVTEDGAITHGIENWMDGIVTRGVLYDIPLLRGVPYIPANEPVQGWELEDFAKLKNIQPEKGDAVIINFGRNEYFKVNSNAPNTGNKKPGLNPSVLEFLDAYEVALLGSEFDEAINTEYSATFPIHSIANPYMGMPTLWHLDLQRLTKVCEERNTWEFYVIIAPLIVTGGTGSVVNPIAIL